MLSIRPALGASAASASDVAKAHFEAMIHDKLVSFLIHSYLFKFRQQFPPPIQVSLSPQALLPTKPVPPSEVLPNTPLPLAEVVKNLSAAAATAGNPDAVQTAMAGLSSPSESPLRGAAGGRASSSSTATIYSCDQCDKTFTKKSSITRHKYEHSGWFACMYVFV